MGAVPGWPATGESESPRAPAGDQSHRHWSHSAGLLSRCNALSRHDLVPRSSHHPMITCTSKTRYGRRPEKESTVFLALWPSLPTAQLLIAHSTIASFPGLPTAPVVDCSQHYSLIPRSSHCPVFRCFCHVFRPSHCSMITYIAPYCKRSTTGWWGKTWEQGSGLL